MSRIRTRVVQREQEIADTDNIPDDLHLKGTWNGTRLAGAIVCENGDGAIVNMSSLSGKIGLARQTNYSAAKTGIVRLSKAAAKELAHLGCG